MCEAESTPASASDQDGRDGKAGPTFENRQDQTRHREKPRPRGRGIEIAVTLAPLAPHVEHRMRFEMDSSVADLPQSRASASGSVVRDAPHEHLMRTRKCPSASSSFLM
jgi:hypothetical protein